jgi:hypothetical protein
VESHAHSAPKFELSCYEWIDQTLPEMKQKLDPNFWKISQFLGAEARNDEDGRAAGAECGASVPMFAAREPVQSADWDPLAGRCKFFDPPGTGVTPVDCGVLCQG